MSRMYRGILSDRAWYNEKGDRKVQGTRSKSETVTFLRQSILVN